MQPLTKRQHQVWDALRANPSDSQTELAKRLKITPGVVNEHLQQIAERGWAVRYPHQSPAYKAVDPLNGVRCPHCGEAIK